MTFVAGPEPQVPEGQEVLDIVWERLRELEDELPFKSIEEWFEEPTNVEGMLAYADGTWWDPGSGRGLYRRGASAWEFIGPTSGGGGTPGVSDHGALNGLDDDDHLQYLTEERGDARYYPQTQLLTGALDGRYYTQPEVDALIAGSGSVPQPTGAAQILYSTGSAWAPTDAVTVSASTAVGLRYAGTTRLETTAVGGRSVGTEFQVDNGASADGAALLLRNSEGGLRASADGNTGFLLTTDNLGQNPQTAISMVRGSATNLYHAGALTAATIAGGFSAVGQFLQADNLTGNSALVRLRESSGGLELAHAGGSFALRSTDTDWLNDEVGLSYTRGNALFLNYAGALRANTTSAGFDVQGDLVASGQVTVGSLVSSGNISGNALSLASDATILGNIDVDGTAGNDAEVQVRNSGGAVRLVSNGNNLFLQTGSSAGTSYETALSAVDNGATNLFYNNALALATTTQGFDVYSSSNPAIYFRNSGGTELGRIDAEANDLTIRHETRRLLQGAGNGTTILFNDNGERIRTTPAGMQVTGTQIVLTSRPALNSGSTLQQLMQELENIGLITYN